MNTLEQAGRTLPTDLGDDSYKKKEYLKFRVGGFDHESAMKYTGVDIGRWTSWMYSPAFMEVIEHIGEYQDTLAEQLLQREYLKQRLQLAHLDSQILDSAILGGIGNLDDKEFKYLESVKKSAEISREDRASLNIDIDVPAPKSLSEMAIYVKQDHGLQEIQETQTQETVSIPAKVIKQK